MGILVGLARRSAHCTAHSSSRVKVECLWGHYIRCGTAWARQAGTPALVEADVARAPKAEQLQIDAARLLNQPLILLAVPAKQATPPSAASSRQAECSRG